MNKNTLTSIGAVLAGFVAVFVLSLGTDVVLHATGVFPPWGQPMSDVLLLLATVYRTVYGVAGSYITARLAPDRPMGHALVLGTNSSSVRRGSRTNCEGSTIIVLQVRTLRRSKAAVPAWPSPAICKKASLLPRSHAILAHLGRVRLAPVGIPKV